MEEQKFEYQDLKLIYESEKTSIFRARPANSDSSVILKMLRSHKPTLADNARMVRTYEITNKLTIGGIIHALRLSREGKKLLLVLEDVGGISFDRYLEKKPLGIQDFLNIAISLAGTLGDIHQHQIIHKDIKPTNIIIHPETRNVYINDFGISSTLSHENPKLINRHVLEGTINYISPEQTGRMNRDIDYRTDIYSLGITFYEALTGRLPFESEDSLTLIHQHIAKQPTPPKAFIPSIPAAISDIIMKCMAKMPENRYHSAYGLKNDLEECRSRYEAKGEIDDFVAGERDIYNVFQIPQALYGRNNEIQLLLEIFDGVTHGNNDCVFISGYAGVGKTCLINEIQKPIVKQRGYFVKGKFDQLKQDVPYSGLIQALTDLIHQALTQSETDLTILKHTLLGFLHNNGQILIDLIPELELIIGKQPPASILESQENQNRLKLLFKNFIRVFSKEEHPLVIFLDDLHWASGSTLILVKELVIDPSIHHFLLIGTYRNQEVADSSPLMLTLEEIKKEKNSLNELQLEPLNLEDIKNFAVDTVHCSYEKVTPFALILYQKSGGNPFFLIQFLKKLYQDNCLYFNSTSKTWEWEYAEIQKLDVAENVIDLLVNKIQKLPSQTQSILSVAAAIGLRFDLRLVSLEANLLPSTTLKLIWKAITEEIIQPIGENYRLIESHMLEEINESLLPTTPILFEFNHDRIQQVFYSLISSEEKTKIHYKLGKILLQRQFGDPLEENIFEITYHLNSGLTEIEEEQERLQLAKMNLHASIKAKNSAAYSTAYDCIEIAQRLLGPESWSTYYELTYQVYMELTECSYLTQRFANVDELSGIILKNARSNLEKGNLYIIKIILYTNIAQTNQAVDAGLECLQLFGINFERNPSKFKIIRELLRIRWKMRKISVVDLENLPEMKSPEKLFLMRVLSNLSTPSFILDKNLLCMLTLKMMDLTLNHGACSLSYFLYISYATILQLLFRDYETSNQLGALAIKIAERSNNNTFRCRANFVMASVINHWKHHLKSSEKYMQDCYMAGLESGEVMYTSFISVFWGFLEGSFFINLSQALSNLRRYKNTIYSIRSKQPIHSFIVKEGLILALQDPAFRGDTIHYKDFDEPRYYNMLYHDSEMQVAFQAYVAYRLILCHLFGCYDKALELLNVSAPTRRAVQSLTQERELVIYHSLTLTALYPQASFWQKCLYRWQIRKNQNLVKKWVKACPENNIHRYHLVEAEWAKIDRNPAQALKFYDLSIKQAHENGYFLEEALASERAALLSKEQQNHFIADAYLRHAYSSYLRAEAYSKVTEMEEKNPELIAVKAYKRDKGSIEKAETTTEIVLTSEPSPTTENASYLDLATVLQATTIISGSIHLETLLNELMKITVESAGADRGLLLLDMNDRWLIQAEKDLNKNRSIVLQGTPFEKENDLISVIIVQYVIRTKQVVVLNDALHMGMFTEDPYINRQMPKSILCLPVSHQGKLSSILYFENNATTDVFTPHRLDLLQMLSGQISTSIENATLYSNLEIASNNLKAFNKQLEDYSRNLEEKVDERTKELQSKNEQLHDTLAKLKGVQKQVIQQEKLAALGVLAQGIAHEIKNPLNFINNFSSLSLELLEDLYTSKTNSDGVVGDLEREELLKNLKINLQKIHEHSLRIDGIIISVLRHSKDSKGEKESIDLNLLLKEYVRLSKQNFQDRYPETSVEIEMNLDPGLKKTQVVSQDIGRSLINILDNAFYAVNEKRSKASSDYHPCISIRSKQLKNNIEILIRDNGMGIPKESRERLFQPFFTTKPTGTGTGLGLSIAYDIIVQEHSGQIQVHSKEGEFAEFIIELPWISR